MSIRLQALIAMDSLYRNHNRHANKLAGHPILVRELKAEAHPEEITIGPDLTWMFRGAKLVEDERLPIWEAEEVKGNG